MVRVTKTRKEELLAQQTRDNINKKQQEDFQRNESSSRFGFEKDTRFGSKSNTQPTPSPEPTLDPTPNTTPSPTSSPSVDPNLASDKQKAFMDSLGLKYDQNISKKDASVLLTEAIAQQEKEEEASPLPKLATDAQKSYLISLGVQNFSDNLTISEASKLIAAAVDARESGEGVETFGETNIESGTETDIIQEGQEAVFEQKEYSKSERRKIIEKYFGLSSRERSEVENIYKMSIPKSNKEDLIEQVIDNKQGGLEYLEHLIDPRVNSPPEFSENDLVKISDEVPEIKEEKYYVNIGDKKIEITKQADFIRRLAAGETTEEERLTELKNFGTGILIAAGVGAVIWGGSAVAGYLGTAGVSSGTMVAAGSRLAGISSKSLKALLSNPFTKLAAGASSVDILMTWLASDNILQGTSMYVNQLKDAVKWDGMSKEEAKVLLADQKENFELAVKFITISGSTNPILWPFKKLLLRNVDTSRNTLELAESYFE